MARFLVTYGNHLINNHSWVEAETEHEARTIVQEQIGPRYCTIYSEELGCEILATYPTTEIPLTPHRD